MPSTIDQRQHHLITTPIALAMTVYNRQDYLAQALDSIRNQTYPHWQLILWDDGSTDDSPKIARHYAQQDDRIRFIAATHTGRAAALQSAISFSTAPYLAWIDDDDLLAPLTLAATIATLHHNPQIGMVYTDCILIDSTGKELGLDHRSTIPYSPKRLLVDFMTFHFRLIRREIYNKVGGIDLNFPCAQDYDICLKISEVTEIKHIPASLYCYRQHPHSISQARQLQQRELSAQAVKNALIRRGLSNQLHLQITEKGQFQLRKK
jgi:glycosyltransferase involved in cell wall biosynthesis